MLILICSFQRRTRKIHMVSHAEHFGDTLPDCPDKAQHKAHREFTWIARKAQYAKGHQSYPNKDDFVIHLKRNLDLGCCGF